MTPRKLAVPEDWIVSKVGEECSIDNHLRLPICEEERKEMQGIYPYYGPTKAVDFLDRYRVEGQYALIGEDGDHFLKYASQDMTQLVEGQFNVNNHAHLVRGNGRCTTEWFYTYFRRHGLTPYLTRQGAGRYKLNKATLESLPILIPPVLEQIEIFRILRGWDRAIDLTDRLITEKRLLRKGLMQQLLTGKRRLPGFRKTQEIRHTKWGDYPAEWGYPCIGEVAKHYSITNKEDDSLPVLSCTKHQGLVNSLEYFGKQIFSKDLSTYKVVRRGQFAYATNHVEEGSIGYQNLHDRALISPMYTVFEAGKNIDDRFLFLLLKTELYRHIFQVNTSASVDRRGSLRWPEFSRLHVPLPSLEEQRAIVKVIKVADRELELLQIKAVALREQNKGLMQQLLTGKKRVKV